MGRCVATRADRHWSPIEANAFVDTSRLVRTNLAGLRIRLLLDRRQSGSTQSLGDRVKKLHSPSEDQPNQNQPGGPAA